MKRSAALIVFDSLGLFLVVSLLEAAEVPSPVASFTWSQEEAPVGENGPKLVTFRDGPGLQFSRGRQTVIDLTATPQGRPLEQTGPLTLAVVVWAESQRLTGDPGPEVASLDDAMFAEDQELPPVRAITHGPKFHWFSYYDKFQFDPTDRYVLGMEVAFEHRSPTPDDGSLSNTVLWHAPNGHQSYIPGTNLEWIVTDTYPMGSERLQHLYLYHVPTRRFVPIGRFHSPPEYSGEWRCDTHPRVSRDGTKIVVDSPTGGNGRQLHMIDIHEIIRPTKP